MKSLPTVTARTATFIRVSSKSDQNGSFYPPLLHTYSAVVRKKPGTAQEYPGFDSIFVKEEK
jgi:hypothetical protein